ncbi:branched-chain amino acid ABC transporter permease [Galbitalea sp. SE-J8]|uniref:branched-chain amino acid ABC transporter permease n=1 Tax=Galbitalea sp. SE-J8 TaxID=3054952 RepID=UPI00259C8EDB|nr:branched-chain amino acid ABC transporter permease [Galbitalea sp. SE-J8]MDM4761438.1 branched-chain amino acid ABC transporter permease [Galbitalea sp. SE-J8]
MNHFARTAGDWISDRWATVGDRVSDVVGKRPVKIPLIIVGVALVYLLPILNLPIIATPESDFPTVLFTVTVYAIVAVGLNIVTGYAGLLDLGYVGFYATGAYVIGLLTAYHFAWPFLLVLPIAMLITLVTGVLLGAPTLRVRGDYLAIVTMGFGELIRITIRNTAWLGGTSGIKSIPAPQGIGDKSTGVFQIPHLDWSTGTPLVDLNRQTKFLVFGVLDATPYFWLALTALIVIIVIERLVKRGRVGRMWEATREDEDAAEIMGVPTFKFKLLAFASGAFIGGLAGALFASKAGYINPISFPANLSMLFVAAVVIGGSGNRWGAIIGAIIVAYLPERFRQLEDWRLLFFGIALVAIVSFRPQGLFPPGNRARAQRAARRAARDAQREVPVV